MSWFFVCLVGFVRFCLGVFLLFFVFVFKSQHCILYLSHFYSESKIHAVIVTVRLLVRSGYMIKFFCKRFKIRNTADLCVINICRQFPSHCIFSSFNSVIALNNTRGAMMSIITDNRSVLARYLATKWHTILESCHVLIFGFSSCLRLLTFSLSFQLFFKIDTLRCKLYLVFQFQYLYLVGNCVSFTVW